MDLNKFYKDRNKKVYNILISFLVIQLSVSLVVGTYTQWSMQRLKHFEKYYGEIDFVRQVMIDEYYEDYDQTEVDYIITASMFDSIGEVYSYYKDPVAYESFKKSLEGKTVGIGIKITYNDGYYIDYIYPDSPAESQGIVVGDLITSVNGEDTTEFIGNPFDMMSTVEGETIKLGIDGSGKVYNLEVSEINISPVTHEVIDNKGYIFISEFSFGSHKKVKDAIIDLNKKGIDGLIIDLRNNTGGSVSDATKIAGYLGIKGLFADLIYKDDVSVEHTVNEERLVVVDNIVVLVNKYTASASEILAYNLELLGAKTVGENTYGKGVSQNMIENHTGSGVMITVAENIMPDGGTLEGGIRPQHEIELPFNEVYMYTRDINTDTQLKKAVELLNEI